MKRFFAAACALACVIATSAALAAPNNGTRGGRGVRIGPGVDATQGMRVPSMQNRIPAPLPPPAQPPVINGPLSPSGLPPMGGAR